MDSVVGELRGDPWSSFGWELPAIKDVGLPIKFFGRDDAVGNHAAKDFHGITVAMVLGEPQ